MSRIKRYPPFGELQQVDDTDLWERTESFRMFSVDHDIMLRVQIDEKEGVERQQVAAHQILSASTSRATNAAETALLDYYKRNIEDFRDGPNPDLPDVENVEQLSKQVAPASLFFPYGYDDPTFAILFECKWDLENGAAVVFANGVVSQVGTENIVI